MEDDDETDNQPGNQHRRRARNPVRRKRTLWVELARLREVAGIPKLAFHALKKAFCTLNAPLIPEAALGFLAQHESPLTTKKHYINPTAKIEEAVAKLFVPECLRTGTGG